MSEQKLDRNAVRDIVIKKYRDHGQTYTEEELEFETNRLFEVAKERGVAIESATTAFRFNCIQAGVTYSRCNLTKERVLEAWQQKFGDNIEKYLICREEHDGEDVTKSGIGEHIHGYIRWRKKVNYKDPRFMDIDGFHPKIESLRSAVKWVQYCVKEDGNPLKNFDVVKKSNHFKEAVDIAKAEGYKPAREHLIENTPEAYLKFGSAIESNLKKLVPKPNRPLEYQKDQFSLDLKWNRSKALILWGPSGCGKTSYAKALLNGRYLYVSHIDALKRLNLEEHDGVIFDDMCFTHWPREAQIHLVDVMEDSDINVRYGTVELPYGLPVIFTTNVREGRVVDIDDPAINRRCQVVKVETLY